MTRKETLLLENYRLYNELYTLRGNTENLTDLDSLVSHWKFRDEAKNSTVYDLQSSNESLRKSIDRERKVIEQKAAAEAYFATEEGQARKAELLKSEEELCQRMTEFMGNREAFFNGWIKEFLGNYWKLYYLSDSRIEFAIADPKDENKEVFGQSIEIYFEKHYWNGKERFDTNVGTCGGFDLLACEQGDRARFYIDLGRFLSDKTRLEALRTMLFRYKDTLDQMREGLDKIESELENPLAEK
nr:MAG TPA: hypothetical protein [Caudoviricetes sp.]